MSDRENLERVGIVFDPDRLPSPLKQKIACVGTGFGIEVQKPADDARGLVSIFGSGQPRVEIGALFRRRFRSRLVLFHLRRLAIRLARGRLAVRVVLGRLAVRLALGGLAVQVVLRRIRWFSRPSGSAGQKDREC